jgi:hypothetical protein
VSPPRPKREELVGRQFPAITEHAPQDVADARRGAKRIIEHIIALLEELHGALHGRHPDVGGTHDLQVQATAARDALDRLIGRSA